MDTVFKTTLTKFIATLSPEQVQDFQLANVRDVYTELKKIEDGHARDGLMRGLRRANSFLEGMRKYSKVIEVSGIVVVLSQSSIEFRGLS